MSTKTIEIHNYRFSDEEASLLQGGVWERFNENVREANTEVRRFLGSVLKNEQLRCQYDMLVNSRERVSEMVVIKVGDTGEDIMKVEMRQVHEPVGFRGPGVSDKPWLHPYKDMHSPLELQARAQDWVDAHGGRVFKNFAGKECTDLQTLLRRLYLSMHTLSKSMLGHYTSGKRSCTFALRHAHSSQNYTHEIVFTLYV